MSDSHQLDSAAEAGTSANVSAQADAHGMRAARLVIEGFYGAGNTGDEAILAGMLTGLRSVLPDVEVVVISHDAQRTRELHRVMAVDWRDLHGQSAWLQSADALVFGGGGLCNDYWAGGPADVFDDTWSGLAHYLRVPLLAHLHEVPTIVLAQGVGPLVREDSQRMVRQVLDLAADIIVRDQGSADLLRVIGFEGQIDVSADPALLLEADEGAGARLLEDHGAGPGGSAGERPLIGISVRSFQGITEEHFQVMTEAIGSFAASIQGHVVLLPFHSEGASSDEAACLAMSELFGEDVPHTYLRGIATPQAMLGVIGHMSCMIGMRYHAGVFALHRAVPYVSIAYDPKVSHLVDELQIDSIQALRPDELTDERLARALEEMWADREASRVALQERYAGGRSRCLSTFERVGRLVAERACATGSALSKWEANVSAASIRTRWLEEGQQWQAARNEANLARQQARDAQVKALQAEDEAQRSRRHVDELEGAITRLKATQEELKRKLRFTQESARDIAHQLQEIWDSPIWQMMDRAYNSRYIGGVWRRLKMLFPASWKARMKQRLSRRGESPRLKPSGGRVAEQEDTTAAPSLTKNYRGTSEIHEALYAFLERVESSPSRELVVFFAGVKFIESEGQRVTQIIKEFIGHKVPVLLLYFRWESEYKQPVPESHGDLFFQIPLDLFEPIRRRVMAFPFRSSLRKTFIVEFPHPWAFQWINEFNVTGWKTVYDIIDDWEEFHAAGKAVWYEEAVERSLCANAHRVTAIVPLLAEKARRWVPELETTLVPNGVSIDSFDMTLPAKDLPRGEITVGYFGYLTPAWFHWEMLAAIAARRPTWQFHIIGYGEPCPVKLTDNVHLLGRVPHHQLYAYVQCWDVATVPFIPHELTRGADPIKVYEYLTLGLPVVATDIPHLRAYPGVWVAESEAQFEAYLAEAARAELDRDAIRAFVESCTWYQRGLQLIEAGQKGTRNRLPAALLSEEVAA